MFSWPFLFPPLHKDGDHSGLHRSDHRDPSNSDYYDSSDSSSSDESDSRFMSVRDTSFIALHSHHRVHQLENVIGMQNNTRQQRGGTDGNGTGAVVTRFLPTSSIQPPPKGHDDDVGSQISFDYGSCNASVDTTSVGLNPYHHDNSGNPSHFDIGMKWKKHRTPKVNSAVLEPSFGSSSSVPRKVLRTGNHQVVEESFSKVYSEKKLGDQSFCKSPPPSQNVHPQPAVLKIKRKYSDSQFQISPVGIARKTALPSALSTGGGTEDKSQFNLRNGRKENSRNVRLVLGSGKETSAFNRLHNDDNDFNDDVNVMPSTSEIFQIDEDSDDFLQRSSYVDWPSSEAHHVPISKQPNIHDGYFNKRDSMANQYFKKMPSTKSRPKIGAKTYQLISKQLSPEKNNDKWDEIDKDMMNGKVSELNSTMPMSDDDDDGDEDSLDIIMNEGEEKQLHHDTLVPGNCDKSDSSGSSLVYSTSDSSASIPNRRSYSKIYLDKPINIHHAKDVSERQCNIRRQENGTPDKNITDYNVKRLNIRKAAEKNCLLLSLFDTQDRRLAAQAIQKYYRGFRDRHRVLQMIGIAKRKRWDKRTKSLAVTKIHSNFRRLARQRLRSKCEAHNGSLYVGCMAVEILHVCSNVIQIWWKKYGIRLKTRRVMGYQPLSLPSHWKNESKGHNVPAFVIDNDRVSTLYDCQRLQSAASAATKVTSTTISLSSDHLEKDYYSRPNANLIEDDECLDEVCNLKNENFEASISLLTKLHKGVIGRIVKIFRRVPRRSQSKRKSNRSKKRFRLFGKDKASKASPKPMLGDPEVNAELPDPLSLYHPLDEEEEIGHDLVGSSTPGFVSECSSQIHDNDEIDAFSLAARSVDHFMLQEEDMNFYYTASDDEGISIDDSSCPCDTSSNASAEESVPWDEV